MEGGPPLLVFFQKRNFSLHDNFLVKRLDVVDFKVGFRRVFREVVQYIAAFLLVLFRDLLVVLHLENHGKRQFWF